ncbi:hypothetical protein EHF33_19915 (plasmid) [Deinococcus psychrotolerans]|uniref:Uncharacterized protein n=1 Tax=Deinococcus psychrotolerans TaxID=2489213 RepID=A0A3G8YU86_9DEIO|nr:hypothetical protein [Deinococcus psychrotolerans]AZI45181.1 hypothetical protein EHF33_19915 [Deinococcus psychrotolerans]
MDDLWLPVLEIEEAYRKFVQERLPIRSNFLSHHWYPAFALPRPLTLEEGLSVRRLPHPITVAPTVGATMTMTAGEDLPHDTASFKRELPEGTFIAN